MKSFIRTVVFGVLLLATVSGAKAQVSIGITIGPPPPPRVVRVLPRSPDPESMWVEGYWYPVGRRYTWHKGYWTRPPYDGARWVAPRHDGERFFAGYWDGDRGRVEHDHHSDGDHDRDFHDRDDHRDHDRHVDHDKHDKHDRDDR
jgi:hypothetical protein